MEFYSFATVTLRYFAHYSSHKAREPVEDRKVQQMMRSILKKHNYQNVPPEGGWGYFVALSVLIILIIMILSMDTVGIVFGSYFQQFGHEARDVVQISAVFHMVIAFSGLPVNILLQRISNRKVALLGALIYVVGSILTIFCTSTLQMIFTYGVLQGCGIGFLLTSSMTLLKEYFDTRRNFVNNCVQAALSVVVTTFPTFSKYCIDHYGFRGTLVIIAGLGLHLILAAGFLQPVKWHMKRRFLIEGEMAELCIKDEGLEVEVANGNVGEDLLQYRGLKRICSIISNTLDLGLFKLPVYVNIAMGVSLLCVSESIVVSLLPWILNRSNFQGSEIPLLMTIYFTADLVGRVFLCVLTRFVHIRNRYMLLVNAYVTCIGRIALISSNSFLWIAPACAILGFVRCLVSNTMAFVFAEIYPKRFVTAYTLSLVLMAITTLTLGQLIAFVTTISDNKDVIVSILGVPSLLCAISWTIEWVYVGNNPGHF